MDWPTGHSLRRRATWLHALRDVTRDITEDSATTRELLCTPKPTGARPIEGVLFEVARMKGGAEIAKFVDGWGKFLGLTADALTNLVTDLTGRLARNLYERMNIAGLCG